jgi:hypothetical protein
VRRALVLACLLALSAPAVAGARPLVGIGEQQPVMFSSPYWKALRTPYVRRVVSWDALLVPAERAEVDAYMKAAHAARARVLVTFAHSRVEGHEDEIPTTRTWRRLFAQFRKRYPQVKEFQAWNEANHGTQPTWRSPRRAAQIYDVMRSSCPSCTISAPSVLDQQNMLSWIRAFQAAARHRVTIWSLHNYLDANRNRSSGTRKLLRYTTGSVWFTETGGIVGRFINGHAKTGLGVKRAAAAVKRVFTLAALSPRVKRVYFYNWVAPPPRDRWDSALMGVNGRPRPAYGIIRRELARRR